MEIDELDNDNNLPLHRAVEQGDVTLVKALLQQGSKTDVLNNQFESPLHIAVKTGNADIIQLLVQHGCDVNICEDFGHATPVHFAVNAINDSELFHKILLTLLKGGCMLNWRAYSTLESPFYRAVDLQKSRIAAILLKYGSDPSLGSPFDLTTLHKLCQQSNFYLINLVLHCKTNWKRETWLSDDLYSAYILSLYDQDIVKTIKSWEFGVTSLKNMCRVKIRDILRDRLYCAVPYLPLPERLKGHLLLEDIF